MHLYVFLLGCDLHGVGHLDFGKPAKDLLRELYGYGFGVVCIC